MSSNNNDIVHDNNMNKYYDEYYLKISNSYNCDTRITFHCIKWHQKLLKLWNTRGLNQPSHIV